MSLLWPETLTAGLFPGQCWLQRRRGPAKTHACEAARDPQALLEALDAMLAVEAKTLRRGARIDLTVSDGVAAIVPLPWQDKLYRPVELESYARACFDKLGMAVDDEWIVHVEFRRYGETGLAYAVPQAWLQQLIATLQAKGVQLRTVLPVSAAVYTARASRPRDGKTVALLREANHAAALVFGREGLLGHDAEPVAGEAEGAAVRLLRRVGVHHGKVAQVLHWSPQLPEQNPPIGFVADCLVGAAVRQVARDGWSD